MLDQVRELRDAGRTPKEIARALKMPPSTVAPLVRAIAAAEGRTREDALIRCWISPGWSSSVQAPQRPDWPGSAGEFCEISSLAGRPRRPSSAESFNYPLRSCSCQQLNPMNLPGLSCPASLEYANIIVRNQARLFGYEPDEGCGAVAGPCTTDPSRTQNTLPCHGQVTSVPASSPSASDPDIWLHRSASTWTWSPRRTATTGTSPTIECTSTPSVSSDSGSRRCQPGESHRPAGSRRPDSQGRSEAGGRRGVGERVHDANPQLLLVLLRPVRETRDCCRGRPRQSQHRQGACGALAVRAESDHAGAKPGPDRYLHERRMNWMTKLHTVQRITKAAPRDYLRQFLTRLDELVQRRCPL